MTIERVSEGVTYRSTTQEHTFYTTLNHDSEGRVCEIFVRLDDREQFELVMLITRFASMALREGIDPLKVAEELQQIPSGTTNHIIPGTMTECISITARIGLILQQHIKGVNHANV